MCLLLISLSGTAIMAVNHVFRCGCMGCCGLQRRNEECYGPVIQILKYLVHNNLQEGTGAVLNQQGGLSAAAAEEAKAGILRVRLCAQLS